MKIFYSWQSDLPDGVNHSLIGACLEAAVESLRDDKSLEVEPVIDRDTAGIPGAPDIAAAIFSKIDEAVAFVCDVSIVARSDKGRPIPNPNVLIELGYALKALGQERVVLVANLAYGDVEALPFDLRGKRIVKYSLRGDEGTEPERKKLESALYDALSAVLQHFKVGRNFARHSDFGTELVSQLIQIQAYGEELPWRQLKDYLDLVDEQFRIRARWLREESAHPSAVDLGWAETMEELAEELETLIHLYSMDSDDSDEYRDHRDAVLRLARGLQNQVFQKGPVTREAQTAIKEQLTVEAKRLAKWMKRLGTGGELNPATEKQMHGSLTEIGFQLLRLSYYPVDWPVSSIAQELRTIGRPLNLIGQAVELNDFENGDDLLSEISHLHKSMQRILARAGLDPAAAE